MSCRLLVGLLAALGCALCTAGSIQGESAAANEHVAGVKVIVNCSKRKDPGLCRWRRHRLHAIAGHVGWFLGPVGACESGSHSHDLHTGLRAVSPGGTYRGRYQFGMPDWHRAGGRGDPVYASWLEQAYRAVVWLGVNGRGSWPNC